MSGIHDLDFTDEQEQLRRLVRDFATTGISRAYIQEVERDRRFPIELWDAMTEIGLHGLAIAPEYGGVGGSIVDEVIVTEELSKVLGGLTILWSLNTQAALILQAHGTAGQKAELLPEMAAGRCRVGLSITEPGGGTDVLGALETKAAPVEGGFIVNGSKMFSTMVADAHYMILLTRLKNSSGPRKTNGVTVFLLPTSSPGISFERIDTMGHESIGTYSVHYDDVFLPESSVLGEVGNGWPTLTGTLNQERIIAAAMCVGAIAGVIDQTVKYVKERQVFGRPLGQLQAVQHHIANMEISRQASRLLTYHCARLADCGVPPMLESAVAKCYASEAISMVADLGIQVLGGAGYTRDYDAERFWRDTRILRIGPIANEMIRNYVAESLGLPRSF
jgi:acyl-CoA dehydrogenase